jgi:hypothetical protein
MADCPWSAAKQVRKPIARKAERSEQLAKLTCGHGARVSSLARRELSVSSRFDRGGKHCAPVGADGVVVNTERSKRPAARRTPFEPGSY